MPKFPTFPTLYDDVLKINLSKLKDWGYLKPNTIVNASLSWSRNGKETGSISIEINTKSETPYVELNYNYKDQPRNYKVYLTAAASNLNNGKFWYFLCPQTNKRCRKLYSIGGYFLHRTAFKGCMYESQTQSKKYRLLDKTLGTYFKCDGLYEQLYKKHSKKSYAGKPTKRFSRITEKIEKAESIPIEAIERAMIV